MPIIDYVVSRINGDYAYLTDHQGNELMIAMMLLPEGTDVGRRIRCENLEYSLID